MEGMPAVAQNFVAEGEILQGIIFRAGCGCDIPCILDFLQTTHPRLSITPEMRDFMESIMQNIRTGKAEGKI